MRIINIPRAINKGMHDKLSPKSDLGVLLLSFLNITTRLLPRHIKGQIYARFVQNCAFYSNLFDAQKETAA